MKKIILFLALVCLVIVACAPQPVVDDGGVDADAPVDKEKEELREQVETLQNELRDAQEAQKVQDAQDTREKATDVENVASLPKAAPQAPPVVEVITPVFYISMDDEPSSDTEYLIKRRGVELSPLSFGRAWHFRGNKDYAVTTSTHLQKLNDFTMVFWMKPSDYRRRGHMVWQGDLNEEMRGEKAGDGWGPQQEFHISTGDELGFNKYAENKLTFYMGDERENLKITADASLLDWQQVAVVVQHLDRAPRAELFLNGHSLGTASSGIIDREMWGLLQLGYGGKHGPSSDSNRYYPGFLDELQIYDYAMGASDIVKMCRKQNKGKICNGVK